MKKISPTQEYVLGSMTEPQQRRYAEIRAAHPHPRIYNGRMHQTVTALETAGLIEVEYDQHAQAKGNGIQIAERFICRVRP